MPQMAKNGLIAFMGSAGGVWSMKSDGSGLVNLAPAATSTPGASNAMQPFLAPSGTWIAYVLQTEDPYHREIWRMQSDGTGAKALTFATDDPEHPDANAPAITDDETQIAFFSGKEADELPGDAPQSIFTFGHRDVAIIAADGGPRRTLTTTHPVTTQEELDSLAPGTPIVADNPSPHPDGKHIVFDILVKASPVAGMTGIIDLDGASQSVFYPGLRGVVRVPLH
jgi:hypothetical protein